MATVRSLSIQLEDKTLLHVLYGLFLAYPLLGIPAFLALILNFMVSLNKHVQLSELMVSHLKWQRHSAYIALFIAVAAFNIHKTWVATLFLCSGALWFSYRIIRGWLDLNDSQVLYLNTQPSRS